MAEQVTPVEPSSGQSNGQEASELREELAGAQQEILRLRDLLIGKDAELGAARGRLAELEDHSQRLANVAERVQSRLPGLMRIGGAALRRLQRRG
jgi:predicted nuclease with TOPRIM domain